MKKVLTLIGICVAVVFFVSSCNKKCICTTQMPGFEDDIVVYEKPSIKKACKVYQDNQNKLVEPAGGKVACVFE